MPTEKQTWSAASYDENARFVSDLADAVLDWLNPAPGERILDLGCGDGVLAARMAELGATVVGLDSSPDFVAAAKERGIDARLGDGQSLAFDAEFDAVFSNAALHWMTDATAVAAGIARALRPGGRFVAEFGGHGNVAAIVTAMRAVAAMRDGDASLANQWYFPSVSEYQAVLSDAGFDVRRIALIPRPTPLPTGIEGWLGVFCGPFFDQFGADKDAALRDVVALLKPSLWNERDGWTADYVRLRVEAAKRSD